MVLVDPGCGPAPRTITPTTSGLCTLDCEPASGCLDLADRLITLRDRMVRAVGTEAQAARLVRAHGYYRAVRLIESARFWLESLYAPDELQRVYQPSLSLYRRFLCAIQRLAEARSVAEVEERYLDMVRSYP